MDIETSAVGNMNIEKKKQKAKRLSGATMGMRFMQRMASAKNNDESGNLQSPKGDMMIDDEKWERSIQKEKQIQCATTTSISNHDVDNKETQIMNMSSSNSIQTENDPATASSTSLSSALPLFETATQFDMHGTKSDIVGRRSYNNFNKPVEETYQGAVHARRKNKIDEKVSKEHISDEEMMKRYEEYVKKDRSPSMRKTNNGGDRMMNVDVGNLKQKIKKRKIKN